MCKSLSMINKQIGKKGGPLLQQDAKGLLINVEGMLELESLILQPSWQDQVGERTGQESSVDAKMRADFLMRNNICMVLKCILSDCFQFRKIKVYSGEIKQQLYGVFLRGTQRRTQHYLCSIPIMRKHQTNIK